MSVPGACRERLLRANHTKVMEAQFLSRSLSGLGRSGYDRWYLGCAGEPPNGSQFIFTGSNGNSNARIGLTTRTVTTSRHPQFALRLSF
jgi:hypothetical protein